MTLNTGLAFIGVGPACIQNTNVVMLDLLVTQVESVEVTNIQPWQCELP